MIVINIDKTGVVKTFHEKENITYVIKKVLDNKTLKKIAIITLAMSLHFGRVASAKDMDLGKVDEVGLIFLSVVKKIGYWGCIIMCLVEILRCIGGGDYRKVGGVIAKYLVIMAALYGLQWAFDIIVGVFQ